MILLKDVYVSKMKINSLLSLYFRLEICKRIPTFPKQRLSYNQKGKVWRERHLDWAEMLLLVITVLLEKNLLNKKINFDLYGGKLHMSDMKLYLNPYNKITSYSPEKIQHFPYYEQCFRYSDR